MTDIDLSGRVPIRPLCSCLLDQVDVLALRILLCAEEGHCESWVRTGVLRGKACGQLAYMWNNQPINIQRFLWRLTLSELAGQQHSRDAERLSGQLKAMTRSYPINR